MERLTTNKSITDMSINVLHISKLKDLKKWLVKDGWELHPLSNNPYEVLRASKAGKQNPLIIYSGKSSEHLSFADRDMPVIGAFLRDKKKPQTNADRIRSMSDEELLDFLCSIEIHEQGSVIIIEGGVAMCTEFEIDEWLHSEAE